MARGRLVSKSLGSSRKFHQLLEAGGKHGEFFQVLFPLIIANTDDYGRMQGDAFTVKHVVLPSSPRPESHFELALKAMQQVGLLERYIYGTNLYIQVIDFDVHQPNLHKRTTPKFPAPPEVPGSSGNSPEKLGNTDLTQNPEPVTQNPKLRTQNSEPTTALTRYGVEPETADASFLTFACVGKTKEWPLMWSQVQAWEALFPGTGVEQECRKAFAWLEAQPSRRKTAGGMSKFLVGWLNRSVDSRGNGDRRQEPRGSADRRDDWDGFVCTHTPECSGRNACYIKTRLAEMKAQTTA